jgi:hypothetical protein
MHRDVVRLFTPVVIVVCMLTGGAHMTDFNKGGDEADQILAFLGSEEIHPMILEKRLNEFSEETKNKAMARLATRFEPAPSGKLLTRLTYIITAKNKSDMAFVFVENLRSPDPEARASCLYGLEKLGNPAVSNFALLSLRDQSDQVAYAATNILLATAAQDARLWKTLQNLYAARKGNKEFYMTVSLLQAHGIDKPTPPK